MPFNGTKTTRVRLLFYIPFQQLGINKDTEEAYKGQGLLIYSLLIQFILQCGK